MSGYGFGAFLFALISTWIVNPHNIKPIDDEYPKEVANNLPVMLRTMALI